MVARRAWKLGRLKVLLPKWFGLILCGLVPIWGNDQDPHVNVVDQRFPPQLHYKMPKKLLWKPNGFPPQTYNCTTQCKQIWLDVQETLNFRNNIEALQNAKPGAFFLMKNWSWYKMQGPGGISRRNLLPKPVLYLCRVDVFCSGNSDPDSYPTNKMFINI